MLSLLLRIRRITVTPTKTRHCIHFRTGTVAMKFEENSKSSLARRGKKKLNGRRAQRTCCSCWAWDSPTAVMMTSYNFPPKHIRRVSGRLTETAAKSVMLCIGRAAQDKNAGHLARPASTADFLLFLSSEFEKKEPPTLGDLRVLSDFWMRNEDVRRERENVAGVRLADDTTTLSSCLIIIHRVHLSAREGTAGHGNPNEKKMSPAGTLTSQRSGSWNFARLPDVLAAARKRKKKISSLPNTLFRVPWNVRQSSRLAASEATVRPLVFLRMCRKLLPDFFEKNKMVAAVDEPAPTTKKWEKLFLLLNRFPPSQVEALIGLWTMWMSFRFRKRCVCVPRVARRQGLGLFDTVNSEPDLQLPFVCGFLYFLLLLCRYIFHGAPHPVTFIPLIVAAEWTGTFEQLRKLSQGHQQSSRSFVIRRVTSSSSLMTSRFCCRVARFNRKEKKQLGTGCRHRVATSHFSPPSPDQLASSMT